VVHAIGAHEVGEETLLAKQIVKKRIKMFSIGI
jgi:hypothetical protein